MLNIILIVSAVIGLISVLARAIEAVYQLSQTPNLNTAQKCWQVIKNFFTVETYKNG